MPNVLFFEPIISLRIMKKKNCEIKADSLFRELTKTSSGAISIRNPKNLK